MQEDHPGGDSVASPTPFPVPNKPDGLCGHKATLQKNTASFRVQELCEEGVVQCWEEQWRSFVQCVH